MGRFAIPGSAAWPSAAFCFSSLQWESTGNFGPTSFLGRMHGLLDSSTWTSTWDPQATRLWIQPTIAQIPRGPAVCLQITSTQRDSGDHQLVVHPTTKRKHFQSNKMQTSPVLNPARGGGRKRHFREEKAVGWGRGQAEAAKERSDKRSCMLNKPRV